MPKFRVEYGFEVTNYSDFEVEAVDLANAEILAKNELQFVDAEHPFIEMIEEIKV